MAGPSGSIKVEGLQFTIRQLQALGADKTEISNANFEAASQLIRAAKPLVPVKSGRLQGSLRAGRTQYYAVARATAVYANPIHWGWSIVGTKHKGKLAPGRFRNIKPQPFFGEALGFTKEQIMRDYDKNMQQLIDKYHLGKKD